MPGYLIDLRHIVRPNGEACEGRLAVKLGSATVGDQVDLKPHFNCIGVIALRNTRVLDHHWSTAQIGVVQQLHELAKERPVVYLLLQWDLNGSALDAWAVPQDVAFDAFARLPTQI